MTIYSAPQVFPGDNYVTVRKGDVKMDNRTGQYIPTKNPDDWKNVL